MRKKESQASDTQDGFIWDTGNAAADEPEQAAGPPRGLLRPRTLLIGSTALVLVAGAAYGADTLSSPSHHDAAGVAAILPPSSAEAGAALTSPSAGPSPGKSPTPTKRPTSAAPRAGTSVQPATSNPVVGAAVTSQTPAAPVLPAPIGEWLLNETGGNTAVDSTGGHNAWATDGWFSGSCFLLDGTNSQAYTSGAVLATGPGQSFTVSAWVYIKALPSGSAVGETAVSQDGTDDSSFYLELTLPDDRWSFSRVATDSDGSPAPYRALSQSAPPLATWTHLVGVYDAGENTQTLYVNGVAQGTATDSTPFSSSGDLVFGRSLYNGSQSDWLDGAIKDVEVFDVALDGAQVTELN